MTEFGTKVYHSVRHYGLHSNFLEEIKA